MSTSPLLAGIERYLTAKREYEHGMADAHVEALARIVEEYRKALAAESARDAEQKLQHRRILVPIDHRGHPAVSAAIDLAEVLGGPIAFMHVIHPIWKTEGSPGVQPVHLHRDEAAAMLEECRIRVPMQIESEWILREGHPAEEILSVASEWGAEMIVMGMRARGAVAQFFLGSTSAAVVRKATCPVLLVHEPMLHLASAAHHQGVPGLYHRNIA